VARRKTDLRALRRLRQALREVLELPEEATVTVAELTCQVWGLDRPAGPVLPFFLET